MVTPTWSRMIAARVVATAADSYNFSVSYFEEQALDVAKHTNELQESEYVVLNIDYKQNALGSYSCGQWQLENTELRLKNSNWHSA